MNQLTFWVFLGYPGLIILYGLIRLYFAKSYGFLGYLAFMILPVTVALSFLFMEPNFLFERSPIGVVFALLYLALIVIMDVIIHRLKA